jgi:tetratricopeptide (TPR) repeat protein
MDGCLSENQVAELLSGTLRADPVVDAHLDVCRSCLAIVAAAVKANTPATSLRFAIIRELGAGGMGTVYEAFDRERNTRVALKQLNRVDPDTIVRFKREFRALHNLHHPNLVRLGELVVDGERWCFTMELLEGLRFVDYVRPAEHTDPIRLRDGFIQLARGIGALHAAGKVHRDVKSSNVLVTRAGRVVLLDLGLVLDQHSDGDSTGGYPLGTIAYMAPEQALGRRVGPEADWYAAGVLLYQALTGQLPFVGNPAAITLAKQRGVLVAPGALIPGIEDPLNELCLALLQPDPAKRPNTRDVLLALGDRQAPTPPSPATPRASFVGRGHELAALARALDDTRRGQPVAVFVAGESGIGKTALVQRFADDSRSKGTVVLAGRCYERESLPFKAVDGIVDALSSYLAHLPMAEAAAVLPRQAALLARAFPVLARVEPIADAPHRVDVRDPQELRTQLFGALRELFARLADRHPIMLAVDDVHWADADSFALLAELFRQPDAPAILLVATLRDPADVCGGLSYAALNSALGTEIRELQLSSMTADEAQSLAALLIAEQPTSSNLDPLAVASDANGHPLFIDELVRHNRLGRAPATRLDDVLWARIAQLDPAARTILQLAALSGGRLRQRVAIRAARLDLANFELHLSLLRTANLVRSTGASASDHLEPYHDRVRTVVLAHTSVSDAPGFHRQLALSLEAESKPDGEALALHWREAGDSERSAEYTAEAAARASRTLAFDRAAELYRLALELRARPGARDPVTEHALRVELGHALANAGRGAEAAKVYLEAASAAPTSEASDLRRRASEQLIRSGHVDEGVATLHTALRPLGVTIPTTPAQALRSLLVLRAQVRLRGLGYRERDAADVPARALARIDFCWSLSSSLSFVDPLLGSNLGALHLLLALRAGEPSRVGRAFASEAVYAASVGATARAQRLQVKAHEIAKRLDQPYVTGVLGLCDGIVAALLGRFGEAYDRLEDTQRILRAGATGVAWELGAAQDFALELLAWMGRLDELRRRVPAALHETEGRGDLYFSNSLRTGLANNLVLLKRGEVEQARTAAAEALVRWPQRGFQMLHYWNLYANTQIDLYCGDGCAAHARLIAGWPQLESALQMRVQYFRIAMRELRARATLAAARQRILAAPSEARALLAQTETAIRRLRREHVTWADALAWSLAAGVAHVRGDDATTRAALHRAITSFDVLDMALFASAARHRLATLSGGRDGAILTSGVASWFASQGVASPAPMIAMLTPAFETTAD